MSIDRFNGAVLRLVLVALVVCAPLTPAHAGIVGTGSAIALADRAEAEARINGVLMREDVCAQLEALGVDPADAMARVAALTDGELAQLEARLDELPAGGSVLGVLGGLLVVLLVLELLGVTNVFTSF